MPEEQKVTRKLRAILSADVKGYSILMAEDEIFTIKTIKEYRGIISHCINQCSGHVVDSPGDNILAEFASAVDAVQCAVEIQNKLKRENERLVVSKRLEFRIGVNIGDVVQDGDRIYGDGVNVASRIEGLAEPGGVCLSRSVYDQIKKKIGFGFEYMGEHPVKNIPEPVRVYKVLMDPDSHVPLVEEKLELPDKPSIAVLPFTNMSGDPSQEYFSDGLTEQIINGLCKVPNLFVIARNSSFAFKGKSISVKKIAQELGVRYILEGSVQKAGDRVRITTQLIDATTDYHMWSENYDRNLEDIFALQDEITLKMMQIISIKLTSGEQANLWVGTTTNIQAFDFGMRGIACFYRNNEKDNKQARKYIEEAIRIDNNYALAYAMLGYSHLLDLFFGWSKSPLESFDQADKNAEKALSLHDFLDTAHSLKGWIHLFKKQHAEAINEGERGVDLSPNSANAHALLAFILTFSGKEDLSIKLLERAFRLNPIPFPFYYSFQAMNYRLIGDYEKAIEYAEKSLGGIPDQIAPYLILAAAYSSLNHIEEAHKAAEEVLRIDPNFSLGYFANILPFKSQETLDRYIQLLRKAGLPE